MLLKEVAYGFGQLEVLTDQYSPDLDSRVRNEPEYEAMEAAYERAHGEYETINLYSDQIIRLSQIRGTKNKISTELRESIRRRGLLKSFDVVRLTADQLDEYIRFTNQTWKSNAELEQFEHMQHPDGWYYVGITGDTRHRDLMELENDPFNPIKKRPIKCNIQEIDSIDDIIEIQRDENIASAPPQERAAIATVESYLWGQRQGKWTSVEDYMQKRNITDQSPRTIKNALAFHDMPSKARTFVLEGNLPYLIGVQLGLSMDVVKDYAAVQAGYDGKDDPRLVLDDKATKALERDVVVHINAKAQHCVEAGLNSTAGKKHVQKWRADMRRSLQKKRGQDKDDGAMDFEWVSPDEQLEKYQRQREDVYNKQLDSILRVPDTRIKAVIELGRSITGSERTEWRLEQIEQNLIALLRELGDKGLNGLRVEHTDTSL